MQLDLPDGRALAYEQYGDLQGRPVFFFHGTPGSRMFHPPEAVTRRMRVRVVCVDRPGYGGSTFHPGRQMLDWPKDVSALADALGIRTFAVAGHSGGGPYALASAFCLPERVSAAAILSGAGPVDAPGASDGLTFLHWLAFKIGRHSPWSLTRALTWFFFRKLAANPAHAIDLDARDRPAADEEVLKIPGVRENCIESDVEAYRQGLTGFSWEVRLLTRPWGFGLEQIKVPVYLWHGTADDFTTTGMARYMSEKIPGCNSYIYENEGHMLLIPRWEEILTALAQERLLDND
jgi:pimeloyl-ACP methyl ester carboxylesterase